VDDDGAVVPYAADGPGPLAAAVHRAQVILAASEYEAQKGALETEHIREGIDVHVGALVAAARDDGSLFTVAVWSDGVDTLLPAADFVGFVAAGRKADTFTVPWASVAAEVSLTPVDGLYPMRYRVTAWPASEAMDRLRARAVEP
jgi:hypothetical protein